MNIEEESFCDGEGIAKSMHNLRDSKNIDKGLSLKKDIKGFKQSLTNRNISNNTISSWSQAVEVFFEMFNKMNKVNLLAFKTFLIEKYNPKTVNVRISAVNAYIKYMYEQYDDVSILKLLLKNIKIQKNTFLENVITLQQYEQLCNFLKKKINSTDNRLIVSRDLNAKKNGINKKIVKLKSSYEKVYFIVRCLGMTGVRVSELVKFNTQAARMGYFDVLGKGGKVRRIYIPKKLQNELIEWIDNAGLDGFLFVNNKGEQISTRGIAHLLKDYAKACGIDEEVVYPHSFRHMFAKAFLAKRCDIALLSDLLGHSNIETTRIYLRLTSAEQKEIVDNVVNW